MNRKKKSGAEIVQGQRKINNGIWNNNAEVEIHYGKSCDKEVMMTQQLL